MCFQASTTQTRTLSIDVYTKLKIFYDNDQDNNQDDRFAFKYTHMMIITIKTKGSKFK
jgi:hypothetical protein